MADAATLAALIRIRGLEESVRDMKRFQSQMQKSEAQTKKFAGASKALVGVMGGLGVTLGAAGLLRVFGGFIKTAAEFEQSMATVKAISGAVGEEFEQLTAIAREMGRTTQFTASQSADALVFLSQAGFKATESVAALPGVLNLAAAAGIGLAQSADIASNVLTGFGLNVSELGRVNDILTATFTSTNTNLVQLANAMKFVGPVANALGLELTEVSAIIGLMGKAGIQGSMAGRSLRMALIRLINPPKEAADALERLGVSTLDAMGNLRPMADILADLAAAHLGAKDAAIIWGTESVSAMQGLMSQGVPALQALNKELENSQGLTEEIVKIQTDTFNNSLKQLSSAWGDLQIAMMGSNGVARDTIDAWTTILRWTGRQVNGLNKYEEQLIEVTKAERENVVGLTLTASRIQDLIGDYEKQKKAIDEVVKAEKEQFESGARRAASSIIGSPLVNLFSPGNADALDEALSKQVVLEGRLIALMELKGAALADSTKATDVSTKATAGWNRVAGDSEAIYRANARFKLAFTKETRTLTKALEDEKKAQLELNAALLTDAESNQFLRDHNILLEEEGSLMQIALFGLQETIRARIRANKAIAEHDAVIASENERLQEQADVLERIAQQARAAAAAKAAAGLGESVANFAGLAPTAVALNRGFTDAAAAGVFGGLSGGRKAELSVTKVEEFQAFFFDLIKKIMQQTRLDRAGALMRGLQQFAHGGVSGGGLALVGERGPEIVSLPRGAEVFANGSGPGGGSVVINIDFSGAIVGMDEVDDRIAAGVQDGLRQAGGRGRGR